MHPRPQSHEPPGLDEEEGDPSSSSSYTPPAVAHRWHLPLSSPEMSSREMLSSHSSQAMSSCSPEDRSSLCITATIFFTFFFFFALPPAPSPARRFQLGASPSFGSRQDSEVVRPARPSSPNEGRLRRRTWWGVREQAAQERHVMRNSGRVRQASRAHCNRHHVCCVLTFATSPAVPSA